MGGTTDDIPIPRTSFTSMLSMANKLRKRTPYSSTVCVLIVATRQCAINLVYLAVESDSAPGASAPYRPSTVFVFPTSSKRSIVSYLAHSAADQSLDTGISLDLQEPA